MIRGRKENTPELTMLKEEWQKEIHTLPIDLEHETTASTRIEDMDEEKNEDSQSVQSSPYDFVAKDLEN